MHRKSVMVYLLVLIMLLGIFPLAVNAQQSNCFNYTIRSGDTLFRIAVNNGTNVSTLAQINAIPDPTRIYAGTVIVVCPGTKVNTNITINVQVTTTTTTTQPTTTIPTNTTATTSTQNPNLFQIDPFKPCPFIANGAFADCGSYWLELAAGYPTAFFAACVPRTIIGNPTGSGFLQCALTGDRYLRLPTGTVTSTLP